MQPTPHVRSRRFVHLDPGDVFVHSFDLQNLGPMSPCGHGHWGNSVGNKCGLDTQKPMRFKVHSEKTYQQQGITWYNQTLFKHIRNSVFNVFTMHVSSFFSTLKTKGSEFARKIRYHRLEISMEWRYLESSRVRPVE